MTIGFYRWGLYLERHGHWRLTLRFRPHTIMAQNPSVAGSTPIPRTNC